MARSRRSRRFRWVNAALLVVLLVGGAVAYLALRGPTASSTSPATASVARATVESTVSASGSIQSADALDVSFAVSGRVRSVLVGVGDHVEQGDLLAKLKNTDGDVVGLHSPMAGRVSAVDLVAGETIGTVGNQAVSPAGTDASSTAGSDSGSIEITDLSHLIVLASFSETDVAKLEVGQAATVTIDALQTSVDAVVTQIDVTSTVSNNVVDYGVTLRLKKRPAGIRPGQTATVQIVTKRARNALSVPSAAVQTIGGQSVVTILQSGQETQVAVSVGVEGDQTTEIVSGLSEGDQVVIPTTTGSNGFPQGGFPRGGFGFTGGGGPGGN